MPTGLSVTPAETKANPVVITVKDLGTVPVRVTTSDLVLHAKCVMATTTGITVKPSVFTLSPGQAIHVRVSVPSTTGDYGVLFSPHPLSFIPGNNIAIGAIGSQILMGGAQDCIPSVHHIPRDSPVAGSSLPVHGWDLAFIPVTVAAVILVVWGVFLRRRARQLRH